MAQKVCPHCGSSSGATKEGYNIVNESFTQSFSFGKDEMVSEDTDYHDLECVETICDEEFRCDDCSKMFDEPIDEDDYREAYPSEDDDKGEDEDEGDPEPESNEVGEMMKIKGRPDIIDIKIINPDGTEEAWDHEGFTTSTVRNILNGTLFNVILNTVEGEAKILIYGDNPSGSRNAVATQLVRLFAKDMSKFRTTEIKGKAILVRQKVTLSP